MSLNMGVMVRGKQGGDWNGGVEYKHADGKMLQCMFEMYVNGDYRGVDQEASGPVSAN